MSYGRCKLGSGALSKRHGTGDVGWILREIVRVCWRRSLVVILSVVYPLHRHYTAPFTTSMGGAGAQALLSRLAISILDTSNYSTLAERHTLHQQPQPRQLSRLVTERPQRRHRAGHARQTRHHRHHERRHHRFENQPWQDHAQAHPADRQLDRVLEAGPGRHNHRAPRRRKEGR